MKLHNSVNPIELRQVTNIKRYHEHYCGDLRYYVKGFHELEFKHEDNKIIRFIRFAKKYYKLSKLQATTIYYYFVVNSYLDEHEHDSELKESVITLWDDEMGGIPHYPSVPDCISWIMSYRFGKLFFIRRLRRNIQCIRRKKKTLL